MTKRFGVLLLLVSMLGQGSLAQDNELGVLPELTLGHRLSEDWQATAKFGSLNALVLGDDQFEWDPTHVQSDGQLFISHRIHPEWEVALGYHFLVTNQVLGNRFIQQLSKVNKLTRMRIGHRWRTDQTYTAERAPRYRARYRFSVEVPLSGFQLDPSEFYFLGSSEPVASLRGTQFDLEHRLGISIGRALKWRHTKVELGIDYRTRAILSGVQHRAMLRWGWFFKI